MAIAKEKTTITELIKNGIRESIQECDIASSMVKTTKVDFEEAFHRFMEERNMPVRKITLEVSEPYWIGSFPAFKGIIRMNDIDVYMVAYHDDEWYYFFEGYREIGVFADIEIKEEMRRAIELIIEIQDSEFTKLERKPDFRGLFMDFMEQNDVRFRDEEVVEETAPLQFDDLGFPVMSATVHTPLFSVKFYAVHDSDWVVFVEKIEKNIIQ